IATGTEPAIPSGWPPRTMVGIGQLSPTWLLPARACWPPPGSGSCSSAPRKRSPAAEIAFGRSWASAAPESEGGSNDCSRALAQERWAAAFAGPRGVYVGHRRGFRRRRPAADGVQSARPERERPARLQALRLRRDVRAGGTGDRAVLCEDSND